MKKVHIVVIFTLFILIFLIMFLIVLASGARASVFVPEQQIIKIGQIRPGMAGYALTVLQGQTISRIPVEVINVLPRKGVPNNLILAKIKSGIAAAGMSGSPVYFENKLAGAIGYGFLNADHKVVMITPIEEMLNVFSWPDKKIVIPNNIQQLNVPLSISGVGPSAANSISGILGRKVELAGGAYEGAMPIEESAKMKPGEALVAFVAWGDVTIGATGTLTATSKDGKFLAFGHPFLELGAVNFPIARSRIDYIVENREFPFKIGTPVSFVGTVTQDRQQGVGGYLGYFTPSVSASLAFRNKDSGSAVRKGFNIVQAPFITPRLIGAIFSGLIKELWGRTGEGTLITTFSIGGGNIKNAWQRSNLFFSTTNAAETPNHEIVLLSEIFLLNAFKDIFPIGFNLDVEVTQEPRVLYIEEIVFEKETIVPGDTIEIQVKLRPWRKNQLVRSFDLKVPEDASGMCEIIVRGGAFDTSLPTAIIEGWKSIDSFDRMLTELDAIETNNELIVELNTRPTQDKNEPQNEYLSEIRDRRIKEGNMRIFRSDYFVDGLMRKQVNIRPTK
ncbi:MAG: hypothetical protein FWG09_04770 [Synergistaceae bacterium]|nr:hypothetical protein [Synergistaceae bacterium]